MKRRRLERKQQEMKRAEELEQQRAEEECAAGEARRMRRMQNAVMLGSLMMCLLIAGLVRRHAGESFPISHAGQRGWAGGLSDPLIDLGLLGGLSIGSVISWIIGYRFRRRRKR